MEHRYFWNKEHRHRLEGYFLKELRRLDPDINCLSIWPESTFLTDGHLRSAAGCISDGFICLRETLYGRPFPYQAFMNEAVGLASMLTRRPELTKAAEMLGITNRVYLPGDCPEE